MTLYPRNVSARDPRLLEIQAQVSGSLEGVHYKWFATAGQCNPQESTIPVTRFRFAPDSTKDQITVDVWRHEKRIGRGQLEVKVVEPISPAVTSNLKIEITMIPFAEKGGPETRAEIAGRVLGEIPPDSRIVLYARDEGVWFIQPTTNARHKLSDEGIWSSWTHSGSAYAAILVPHDFVPLRTLDTIPPLRSDVLARVVVDGRTK
ncbi:MAG TPA: hypothetical protein VHF69_11395 [Candidatus Synoicihabitans sp.]|nr:hypothetical protein [Candidatus Synoicihabitans sp.]